MSDFGEGLKEALEYAGEREVAATGSERIEVDGQGDGRLIRFVTPEGYKAEMVDLEKYESSPRRKTGTATLRDLESFMAYVARHRGPGTSVYREKKSFTAIINGHEGQGSEETETEDPRAPLAGWGDHRAVFEPKWTPSWTAWETFNNQQLSQDDFAQFLNDRIPDIGHPPAGDILDAVLNLRLHWNATYERVVQPNNDFIQLTYIEDSTGGTIKVPAKFTIMVAPFEGAEDVVLDVALRFAKPDAQGKVKFQFRLEEKASQVVDDEFVKMQARIAGECGVPVFWGSFAAKSAS